MSLEDNDSFDIDAGVDEIASDMGWGTTDDAGEERELDVVADESQEQETETAGEETEEQKLEVTAKAPPASWAKEHHETWSALTPQAQEYIELREKQMLDGIEQYKAGHAYAQELAKTIEPYRDMLQQFGVNEAQAVENSLGWNRALTSGSIDQRQEAFIRLGTQLGLIPQEGQTQVDPRTYELQQRLDRIERQEQQRAQETYQQNLSRVASEVEAFANDPKNEHFEEVADDVIILLKGGLDLSEAYARAVWANPITRAKEQAKLVDAESKARLEKQKADAKTALKAKSANVRPTKTNAASSEPLGSWDDTMQEVLDRISSE